MFEDVLSPCWTWLKRSFHAKLELFWSWRQQIKPQLRCLRLPPVWVLNQSGRKRQQQPVILASRQHTDHISIQSYIYLLCSAPLPCRPFFFAVALLCSVSASGFKGRNTLLHLHLGGFNTLASHAGWQWLCHKCLAGYFKLAALLKKV